VTVDFAFSEEQLALRDLARELFERESPPSRLRRLWESDESRDDKVWRTMAEAGLLGITVPEEHGGLGGDDVDLALVLEEVGRSALPDPFVDTVAIAAPLIAEFGTGAQREEWLPRIANGDAIVAAGFGWAVTADADVADLVLTVHEAALHAVPRGRFRVTRTLSPHDRARRLFEVETETDDTTLMTGGADHGPIRGAVAVAGVLNGIAMKLLEMTVDHVKSRTQFGRPVGSFQAVKHKLATAHVMVESSRASAWYAAYALSENAADRDVAASVAKANAAAAEGFVNVEALQCHGGIGFTWEHDLHLWLKRGMALRFLYGSAAEHRQVLGASVLAE
jgi:alkylation response protein AidB-like acyl-CoA dehydrogenase